MKKAILSKGIFVITIFLSLFWLMPLIFIFMNSFKGDAEIINHFLELPKEWTLQYYFATWNKFNFPLLLKNTVFYTVSADGVLLFGKKKAYVPF